jgi:MFS family permease
VYAWYVVAVLTIAYIFSFIDRQILSLLQGPIKRDLKISDFQLSLLMGPSFALFYTLFGIPLGRLADTKSRRAIISIGIAFWSLMTAACGLTRRYWDLALFRMGVGVGEAALSPPAYSLIADYFPPHRRATAMSVYSMGIYIGSGLAFILGGMIVQYVSREENVVLPIVGSVRNWQMVFFVVGLPGLLVALLLLTVSEPKRKSLSNSSRDAVVKVTFKETMAYILENKGTFICLNLGIAMVTLNSYASSSWIPAMFVRRFAWGIGQTGTTYGVIVAICGTLGVVSGGWLADRLMRRGCQDAPVRVAWWASLCGLPFTILFPLSQSGNIAALFLIPMVFFGSMPFGVAPAAIQRMMPNTMRAQATAIYLFVINLIGMGLGPTVAAAMTDKVFKDENAVHQSLMVVGVVSYLCASILLGISLKSYRHSLDYLQRWSETKEATVSPSTT